MSETSTLIGYQGRTISREELALIQTPAATSTHVPIPHHEIVQALVETFGFRHIRVAADEYAVSPDGMRMFGVLDLETEMHGCRFAIGVRNSRDRSMSSGEATRPTTSSSVPSNPSRTPATKPASSSIVRSSA